MLRIYFDYSYFCQFQPFHRKIYIFLICHTFTKYQCQILCGTSGCDLICRIILCDTSFHGSWPGTGHISSLCQRGRKIKLCTTGYFHVRTCFACVSCCDIMEFHTSRQFHGNGLQCICLKGDYLCPLFIPFHICSNVSIWKGHCYIRNFRLIYTIIIQFHCQRLSCAVGSGKSITAPICVWCRKMRDNKSLSCWKIRVFLCEKSLITGCLCSVVTNLC